MDSPIIQSGTFVSTGAVKNLSIRSDLDWMSVYNYTQIAANATATGLRFYWQRGMPVGGGFEELATAGTNALTVSALASGGFTLIDQGVQPSLSNVITTFSAFSNSVTPAITVASTAGFSTGDIVIFSQTDAQRVTSDASAMSGIPFQITVTNGTTLTINNALQNSPGALNAAGSVRKVNISSIYYPEFRYVVKVDVTNPLLPIITTSANHGYQVGQLVYFTIPSIVNGMVQMNQVFASITVVTASTFTVSLNTTGFTAFTFPTFANAVLAFPYTNASVSPAGMNTAVALAANNPPLSLYSDAVRNISIIGMSLGAGVNGPAGQAADVIYWVAGKSSLLQFN